VVSYGECKNNRKAFLDMVKRRENKVTGREIAMFSKMTSNGYKLKRNIKNCPDIFEKNIRYGYTVINSKSKQIRDNVKRHINGRMKRAGFR